VSIIQAVTQLQEQTLSFVPKLLAVGVVMLLALPWMMQVIVKYTVTLFRSIPSLTQ
jgi:flagellar biosynthetic protein FliQ